MATDRPSEELLNRLLAAIAADATDDSVRALIAAARTEAEAEIKDVVKSAIKATLLRRTVQLLEDADSPAAREQVEEAVKAQEVPEVQESRPSPSPRGCYVYAIMDRAPQPWRAELPSIDPAHPLQLVAEDQVQAVVSEVSLDEFGPSHLDERASDPRWIDEKVRAHDGVIKALMSAGTVIPCRFCTIVRSADDVRRLLREHRQGIARTLAALAGKREWGVKIFARGSDRERSTDQNITGKSYLHRKQQEHKSRADQNRTARARAQTIHQELAAIVADSTILPARAWKLAGSAEPILNAAYLVADDALDRFQQAISELADRERLDLELTGPWPAYNFIHLDLSLEAAA